MINNNENIYSNIIFIILYIILIVMIFLINKGIVISSQYSCCLIIILMCIYCSSWQFICSLFLLEPFADILLLNGNYTIIPFLLLLYILKIIIFEKNYFISKNLLFISILLIFLNFFTTYLYFSNFQVSIQFALHLIFLIFSIKHNGSKSKIIFKKVLYIYPVSVFLVIILANLFPNAVSLTSHFSEEYRLYRFSAFSSAWSFGRMLLLAITFLIILLINMNNKKLIKTLIICPIIIYFLYWLIASGSISSVVGLFITILSLPLFIFNYNKNKKFYSYFIIFILLIAMYNYIYIIIYNNRNGITDNGRFAIWTMYINNLISSPFIFLFGIGAGSLLLYARNLNTLTAHNILIEIIFEFGLIGSVLYFYILYSLFKNTKTFNFINKQLLPLISFLGTCLTLGAINSDLLYLLLFMSINEDLTNGDILYEY